MPIEVWATPIYDERKNIVYAIAAFQDITERQEVETERRQFTDELQKALAAEEKLTDAYGRFVPHEFLHFLGYESILEVKLGDQVQKEMSVLFSDIRDFTSLSERMNPEENFQFINGYLSRMEPAITDNFGFIDKYIGDAIMALFDGSADDAVKAGIAMLEELNEYNISRNQVDCPPLQIGIGINTGSLMLGTVGGQSRMDSTVISDAVNLASRVETLTKEYEVSMLITHNTFIQLNDIYDLRLIDRVTVKGKSRMVTLYEVFAADPPDLRQKKLETKTIFEQALVLYNSDRCVEAIRLFSACLEINPNDKVAQIYMQRCLKGAIAPAIIRHLRVEMLRIGNVDTYAIRVGSFAYSCILFGNWYNHCLDRQGNANYGFLLRETFYFKFSSVQFYKALNNSQAQSQTCLLVKFAIELPVSF